MDFATVIGLLVATVLVVGSVLLGGSAGIFVNIPSLLLVLGGTLGVTLIRNPMSAVLGTVTVARKAFSSRPSDPTALIARVVELSRTARKDSLLALQNEKIDNPFLAKSINLCVDGLEPAQIRGILETEITATAARHKRGQEILEGVGGAAPAFGMVGTLIGLVKMLADLNDPRSLGPAMALAILTTLYGAVIANLFALPLADKLKVRSREEVLSMMVSLEGALGIAQGENPMSIEEKLRAFLGPRGRATKAA